MGDFAGIEEKKLEDSDAADDNCCPSSMSTTPLSSATNEDGDGQEAEEERSDPPEDRFPSSSKKTKPSATTTQKNGNKVSAISLMMAHLLHTIMLDVPVLVVFGMLVSTYIIEHIAVEFVLPQMDLQEFTWERRENEVTYYHRVCTSADLTATDTSELVVDYTRMTTDDAVVHMNRHGAQVYPNILSVETANEVRDFILRQNENEPASSEFCHGSLSF